jgi:hypothetical protein
MQKVQEEVSAYYLADEIAGVYRGMMIAISAPHWQPFRTLSVAQFAAVLRDLAGKVDMARLQKAEWSEKAEADPALQQEVSPCLHLPHPPSTQGRQTAGEQVKTTTLECLVWAGIPRFPELHSYIAGRCAFHTPRPPAWSSSMWRGSCGP